MAAFYVRRYKTIVHAWDHLFDGSKLVRKEDESRAKKTNKTNL